MWVTNPKNLSVETQQELQALKEQFPSLGQLTDPRESLRAIFDDRTIARPAEGRKRLGAWMEQVRGLGLTALNTFCRTLDYWLNKIANSFQSRGGNGRTEGLNHGLHAILWRAFGMANVQNFRLRVLHCFGLGLA